LALANGGLGAVHGFAGVIGGRTNASHGEICGTLLPAVLESHLRKAQDGTELHTRLQWILQQDNLFPRINKTATAFPSYAAGPKKWVARLEDIVSSFDYADCAASANASSMKGNPFHLSHDDLLQILHAAK
jgi:alcohol dehydrogenase class IV